MYFYLSKLLAPLLNFSNFIVIAILFFLIIHLKFKKKITKIILIFFTSFFFIIAFFPLGNVGVKYLEKQYITKKQNLKYNNIVVLGGAESTYITKFTNTLNLNEASERLILSVDLALKNKDSKIFFLGGSSYLSNDDINEANIAKMFYENIGFDTNRIIFVGSTRNTIENLQKFKELGVNTKNDLLVTSAFHMNRSLFISNKLGLDLDPYAVDFRHSPKNMKLINIYQSINIIGNLGKFDLFFREMLALMVAKLIL